jgi:glycosyltransferase involved in cell wall biosynthesis
MKTALIVAYHFPPYGGGSGILRTLKFCRFLPEFGWQPVVLTTNTRAYERTDPTLLAQIPDGVAVIRTFGLDTQRHLSFRGRYMRWMALPDRWASWSFAAVAAGLYRILNNQVDVIVTTYPIATAVWIGFALHKLTGKPWVIDFRDSMTEDEYPRDPLTRRTYRWLEKKAVQQAALLTFTARSTITMYRKRYPWLAAEKCVLIPNGYDEEDFEWLSSREPVPIGRGRPVRLLHLGLIYPSERDPRPFFRALSSLKKQGRLSASELQIDLRASGSETYYARVLQELDIHDLVHLLPAVPYPQALREAAASDALLLLQAANCDHQIPAKVYEYLRLSKPLLALTSRSGDTATLLCETGGATIVDLADEDAIFRVLPDFLSAVQKGEHPVPDPTCVRRYSRKDQARALAESLCNMLRIERSSWQGEAQPTPRPRT